MSVRQPVKVTGAIAMLAFSLLATSSAEAVPVGVLDFTGSRFSEDGGITTTPTAITPWTNNFGISWDISFDDTTDLFRYAYTFDVNLDGTGQSKEVSHWIFEVSTSIDDDNIGEMIQDENFLIDVDSPTTYGPHPSNPGIPGDIYGVKTDTGTSDTFDTYIFFSPRAPIWGDFYAKDGNTGGPGGGADIFAYNTGFGTEPTEGGPFTNWIPVPDTVDGQGESPEPGTLLLLGAGLIALYRRRRT